jgi:hypothetical protein
MAAEYVAPTVNGGNGYCPYPVSRKTLLRGLPRRLGTLEDQLDHCDRRLDANDFQIAAFQARLANLVEIVECMAQQLRRVDRRSARSRRRVAVIADRVEASLE